MKTIQCMQDFPCHGTYIVPYSYLFSILEILNKKGTEQLKGKTGHKLWLVVPGWFAPKLNIQDLKKLCVCEKKDCHRSKKKRMIV